MVSLARTFSWPVGMTSVSPGKAADSAARALGVVGRLGPRGDRQLGVAPAGPHELQELLRVRRVVRSAAPSGLLVPSGVPLAAVSLAAVAAVLRPRCVGAWPPEVTRGTRQCRRRAAPSRALPYPDRRAWQDGAPCADCSPSSAPTATRSPHRGRIAAALECLHHRGPGRDRRRGRSALDAIFAHKRLSIIDVALSATSRLPYADGRYLLTFNGEIYNYLELREELAREFGAEFATDGDGEVDRRRLPLLGRGGARPAARHVRLRHLGPRRSAARSAPATPSASSRCTTWRPTDGLYLASEKKALLPFADSARRGDAGVDAANLSHYLTLQYVPEPRTLHKGIARIGSGECLTWTPGRSGRRPAATTGRSSGPTPTDDAAGAVRPRSGRRCARACACTCARTCRSARSCPAASTRPRSWRWPASSTRTS